MIKFSWLLAIALAGVYAWCIYASTSLQAPGRLILFTLLLIVHAGLRWSAPETAASRSLYFIIQAGFALAINSLGRNQEASLVLYLLLAGEAAGVIEKPGLSALVVTSFLALYAANFILLWGWTGLPGGLAVAIPMALFLLAYAEITRRQTRSRQSEKAFGHRAQAVQQPVVEKESDSGPVEPGAPQKLAEALMKEIIRFRSTTGIHCSLDLYPLPELPEPLRECIMQTVANGLANIAQYADASQVYIHVLPSEEWVEVEVLDNGIGFDPLLAAGPLKHYGLLDVRERAQLAGGSLEVTSKPGQGTTVRLRLPIIR